MLIIGVPDYARIKITARITLLTMASNKSLRKNRREKKSHDNVIDDTQKYNVEFWSPIIACFSLIRHFTFSHFVISE